MKKLCECEKPAAITVNVTKADGELIERVHLCADCALHPRTLKALEQVGVRLDESLVR